MCSNPQVDFLESSIVSRLTKLASWKSVCVGLGLVMAAVAQPAIAQDVNPNDQFAIQDGDGDIFSGQSGFSGIFDLIHNTRLGGGSYDASEQRENLDDAAASFREQQQQRLRNPQPAAPSEPSEATE